jgi:prepilin-type N-terminal cleavage/methylation domain-containing protein
MCVMGLPARIETALRLVDVQSQLHRTRFGARHGLSLIELLIVIAIMAVVMGMVLTTFWYAIKTVRSFQSSINSARWSIRAGA